MPKDKAGPAVIEIESAKAGGLALAAYEHPWPIRFCHWLNSISLLIMVGSGLRIFMAFPGFGPRVPERELLRVPAAITLGGWPGGALQRDCTFVCILCPAGGF